MLAGYLVHISHSLSLSLHHCVHHVLLVFLTLTLFFFLKLPFTERKVLIQAIAFDGMSLLTLLLGGFHVGPSSTETVNTASLAPCQLGCFKVRGSAAFIVLTYYPTSLSSVPHVYVCALYVY